MLIRFGFLRLAALAGVAWLVGCAVPQALPELPTRLEAGKGLLVARIHVMGMQGMADANVSIDGKLLPTALRDGYIAIALDPGQHVLTHLQANGRLLGRVELPEPVPSGPRSMPVRTYSAPTYIYTPGTSYTVHTTRLSVDRSFRIDSGKVTNLGMIVYLPVNPDPSRKQATSGPQREFNVVNVDNTAETLRFLATNYPELSRSLSAADVQLAPANYLTADRFPALRRAIALHEYQAYRRLMSPTHLAVYGRAGTVALLERVEESEGRDNAKAPPPKVEIVDTGTLADVVGGVVKGKGFAFLTADARLLEVQQGAVTRLDFPFEVQAVRFGALGRSTGLIAVDNQMRLYTQAPGAFTWQVQGGTPGGPARADVDLVPEPEGTYVVFGQRGMPSSLYYVSVRDGRVVVRAVAAPNARLTFPSLDYNVPVARPAGLYVLFGNKREFAFWSRRDGMWNRQLKPSDTCLPIRFDDTGMNLRVECEGRQWNSSDNGNSWTQEGGV